MRARLIPCLCIVSTAAVFAAAQGQYAKIAGYFEPLPEDQLSAIGARARGCAVQPRQNP